MYVTSRWSGCLSLHSWWSLRLAFLIRRIRNSSSILVFYNPIYFFSSAFLLLFLPASCYVPYFVLSSSFPRSLPWCLSDSLGLSLLVFRFSHSNTVCSILSTLPQYEHTFDVSFLNRFAKTTDILLEFAFVCVQFNQCSCACIQSI